MDYSIQRYIISFILFSFNQQGEGESWGRCVVMRCGLVHTPTRYKTIDHLLVLICVNSQSELMLQLGSNTLKVTRVSNLENM